MKTFLLIVGIVTGILILALIIIPLAIMWFDELVLSVRYRKRKKEETKRWNEYEQELKAKAKRRELITKTKRLIRDDRYPKERVVKFIPETNEEVVIMFRSI